MLTWELRIVSKKFRWFHYKYHSCKNDVISGLQFVFCTKQNANTKTYGFVQVKSRNVYLRSKFCPFWIVKPSIFRFSPFHKPQQYRTFRNSWSLLYHKRSELWRIERKQQMNDKKTNVSNCRITAPSPKLIQWYYFP